MKDTAPTMDEIIEVNRLNEQLSYKELHDMKFYDDSRNMTIIKNMTVQLMKHASDDNRKKVWELCKKLSSYSHAPVTRKEYQRMELYAEDKDIVDVALESLRDNYYPFCSDESKVDAKLAPIQGYYYTIAIISQSKYRREECLDLLASIAHHFAEHMPDKIPILKRNMDILKATYPDLGEIIF